MHWQEYWNKNPTKFAEDDFLRQADKTVAGLAIAPAQFAAQVSDIRSALAIGKDDVVLDMCCGNGIITVEVSRVCASIVGIDYSEPMIRRANKYNRRKNMTYFRASALDPAIEGLAAIPFTKIYMYEALQYFAETDLVKLLTIIKNLSRSDARIFFGGVPDKARIWDFYDTEERRADYRRRLMENREAIGTWWERGYIEKVSLEHGYEAQFLPQSALLHSAHYRFDARLVPLVLLRDTNTV
jgi:cyclopropane fatty-acyl-phospholipid synthase-like methyltransferase